MADGEACLSPTSNTADTKSRWSSSGHAKRFDHLPSLSPPFLRFAEFEFEFEFEFELALLGADWESVSGLHRALDWDVSSARDRLRVRRVDFDCLLDCGCGLGEVDEA